MAQDVKAFVQRHNAGMRQAKKELPEMAQGFREMYRGIMKDGALSMKEKELMAVAVGMALQCEACVVLHIRGALHAGASRQEVLETASVVVMMQGGPGYAYLPEVVEALDAFEAGE